MGGGQNATNMTYNTCVFQTAGAGFFSRTGDGAAGMAAHAAYIVQRAASRDDDQRDDNGRRIARRKRSQRANIVSDNVRI